MAVDYQVLTATFSPDGNNTVIESFSPSSGEVWYVDDAYLITNNSGGTSSVTTYFGVRPSGANVAGFDLGGSARGGAEISVDTGSVTSGEAPIDVNFSETEEFVITEGAKSDGATIYVEVHLRRVI